MKRPDDCVYNSMIECQPGGRNCLRCGWNPTVRERRLKKALQTQSYKREEQVKCVS